MATEKDITITINTGDTVPFSLYTVSEHKFLSCRQKLHEVKDELKTLKKKSNVTVSCFHCHTKNVIFLNADFYEARAFYECHSCHKASSVHLIQCTLDVPDNDMTSIQTGRASNG